VNEPIELVGNALCLDFANTVNTRPHPTRDWLSSPGGLLSWASATGLVPDPALRDESAEALSELQSFREEIYDVFAAISADEAPPTDQLASLTRAYATALPQATWRPAGSGPSRLVPAWPAPARSWEVGWHVASSAMQLLQQGPLERVGRCPSCRWLFLDTSRNGQRRWCSMATCGSRTKAARYFAKTRQAPNIEPS
jgi:predicted RNA-binding Zn ribbon-like protein